MVEAVLGYTLRHCPFLSAKWERHILRVSHNIRPRVYSATALALCAGLLEMIIPRSVAASTSRFSTPPRQERTALSLGALSSRLPVTGHRWTMSRSASLTASGRRAGMGRLSLWPVSSRRAVSRMASRSSWPQKSTSRLSSAFKKGATPSRIISGVIKASPTQTIFIFLVAYDVVEIGGYPIDAEFFGYVAQIQAVDHPEECFYAFLPEFCHPFGMVQEHFHAV